MSASEQAVVLVHLSDIHFNKAIAGTAYDLDEDLRNELERDSVRMKDIAGQVQGVLITGDIGFSGAAEEYRTALAWLEDYCSKLGCPSQNVWCTPGNHDVDRGAIRDSALVQNLRRELRPSDPSKVDPWIEKYSRDPAAAELLYSPIANYNQEFASKFRCQIDAGQPFWEHDLALNDGSVLRLHSVNSTLVSDENDNDSGCKLIVGRAQGEVRRKDGVEYVILCHHPPSWLVDQDQLADCWNTRVVLRLLGHKHRERISRIDGSVVVVAGAAHPSRGEGDWKPAYNVLRIWVAGERASRELMVEVYPRVWNAAKTRFQADFDSDGSQVRWYATAIDEWQGPVAAPVPEPAMEVTAVSPRGSEIEPATEDNVPELEWTMDHARRLTYRFLRLPFRGRMKISLSLELIEDNDGGLQDAELFRRVFRRARESGRLEELWQEVAEARGLSDEENPYVGS